MRKKLRLFGGLESNSKRPKLSSNKYPIHLDVPYSTIQRARAQHRALPSVVGTRRGSGLVLVEDDVTGGVVTVGDPAA